MIELAVTCSRCDARAVHGVGAVLLDRDALEGADDEAAWTRAVYVPVSLACPSCGALDAHRVEPASGRALVVDGEHVREGRAALSDGTPIYTPSEGLARLAAHADAHPDDPQGWRALGNFALRAGRADEALAAWRRGAELDGELECALNVAVDAVAREDASAPALLCRALERVVFAQPGRRSLQSAHLAELVRRSRAPLALALDGEPVDVARVRDWSGLGERLARARQVRASPR